MSTLYCDAIDNDGNLCYNKIRNNNHKYCIQHKHLSDIEDEPIQKNDYKESKITKFVIVYNLPNYKTNNIDKVNYFTADKHTDNLTNFLSRLSIGKLNKELDSEDILNNLEVTYKNQCNKQIKINQKKRDEYFIKKFNLCNHNKRIKDYFKNKKNINLIIFMSRREIYL